MQPARRTPQVILLAAAALLAAQAYATVTLLRHGRNDALQEAGKTVEGLVAGAEANMNRGLLQIDALLAGLEALISIPASGDPMGTEATNHILRVLSDQSFLVRDLMILDFNGRVLASGQPATRRRPPPLPDKLVPARGQSQAGVMMIGDPVRNPLTSEWVLYLGRLLRTDDARQLVAVAEFPLHGLAPLLLPTTATAAQVVTLERADGRLLASVPNGPLRIGERLPPITERLNADRRWAQIDSRTEKLKIITAAAPLLYERLTVVACIREADALATWREERKAILAVSALLAFFVVAFALSTAWLVHARERAAAETRRSKKILDQALDAMTDGFVLLDADRRLVLANRRYAELYPHLGDLLVPGTPFERIATRAAMAVLPDATDEERRAWVAWRMTAHRDGALEMALPSGVVVESTQAETPDGSLVSVHRDVTVARQSEARLAAAKQAAEAASRAKSNFLATMSHELRTPLNAIIGFAQALGEGHFGAVSPKQKDYLSDIERAGQHLLGLISAILEISRIEAGKLILSEQTVDLIHLVEETLRLVEPLACKAGVKLTYVQNAARVQVRIDGDKIRQALLNLLGNAIKFTPEGGRVDIRVGVADAGPGMGAGYPFVTVADTGIGMDAADLERVRQPFERVGSPHARDQDGIGLGLPITDALVRLHDGELHIRSALGKGTTIDIRLPTDRLVAISTEETATA
ncbi:MAG TPA: ATP-binding protein [Azospirillaceae bacterium]|nr:ATP-binding protein [Azospirillaceae bacterium]